MIEKLLTSTGTALTTAWRQALVIAPPAFFHSDAANVAAAARNPLSTLYGHLLGAHLPEKPRILRKRFGGPSKNILYMPLQVYAHKSI